MPDRSMETAWSPEMLATPFFKIGEFFSEHPARTSFYSLCNVAQGVFRWIFEEYVNMIWIYSDLDDLNTHLYAGLAHYSLSDHCYIANQHLSPVFRRENKMIGQQ